VRGGWRGRREGLEGGRGEGMGVAFGHPLTLTFVIKKNDFNYHK